MSPNNVRRTLTAYQLFALTVVAMIIGHIAYYFLPDISWLRVHDRILAPVFLISVGYNSGYKLSKTLIGGALFTTWLYYVIFGNFYITILGTIVIVRYIIEPLAQKMMANKEIFWITTLLLVLLYPFTNRFLDYGTLALILALAGWLTKNGQAIENKIIKPKYYMILAYLVYVPSIQMAFNFSPLQLIIFALGTSLIFYILYNMKTLLLNSIRNKPTDIISHTCKYVGKKSLEIYLLHIILLQLLYYYFIVL